MGRKVGKNDLCNTLGMRLWKKWGLHQIFCYRAGGDVGSRGEDEDIRICLQCIFSLGEASLGLAAPVVGGCDKATSWRRKDRRGRSMGSTEYGKGGSEAFHGCSVVVFRMRLRD